MTHVMTRCVLQRLAISVQYGPGERCLDSPSFALCPLVVRNRMCGNKYYAGFCCRSHTRLTVSLCHHPIYACAGPAPRLARCRGEELCEEERRYRHQHFTLARRGRHLR